MLQCLLAYCSGQLRVKGCLHHTYSSVTYNENVFYDTRLLKEPQIKHSTITTLSLLSPPHCFLTEGSQYQNFKLARIPPPGKRSSTAVSEAWFAGHLITETRLI